MYNIYTIYVIYIYYIYIFDLLKLSVSAVDFQSSRQLRPSCGPSATTLWLWCRVHWNRFTLYSTTKRALLCTRANWQTSIPRPFTLTMCGLSSLISQKAVEHS